MFENIGSFFKKIMKNETKELVSDTTATNASKEAAKERLHLVLMQDRANVSADFLELMKQEMVDVIKKYIVVEEDTIDVRIINQENEDGTQGVPSLWTNIPILNIRNDNKGEKFRSERVANITKDSTNEEDNKIISTDNSNDNVEMVNNENDELNNVDNSDDIEVKENEICEKSEVSIDENGIEITIIENDNTEKLTENNNDINEVNSEEVQEEQADLDTENVFENLEDIVSEEIESNVDEDLENYDDDDDDDVTFDDLLKAAEEEEKMQKQEKKSSNKGNSKGSKSKSTKSKNTKSKNAKSSKRNK